MCSVTSVQIAFTCVVFPCLLLAYMGQAAYLMKSPSSVERIFYDSVPGNLFDINTLLSDDNLQIPILTLIL